MKARLPLNNHVRKQIEQCSIEYNKKLERENTINLFSLFLMVACEVMITQYGFGLKRLGPFVEKMCAALSELTDVYEDSTQFKIRKDLHDLGFDFDGEWSKWEAKYHNQEDKSK